MKGLFNKNGIWTNGFWSKSFRKYSLWACVGLLLMGCVRAKNPMAVPEVPALFPDYVGVTIPATIAPMNFALADSAFTAVDVLLEGPEGTVLRVTARGREVQWPMRAWKAMLRKVRQRDARRASDGQTSPARDTNSQTVPARSTNSQTVPVRASDSLMVTVRARGVDGTWRSFKPFPLYVNDAPIDYSLVYRLIAPGYEIYSRMGIYQRELSTFKQTPVYENTLIPQTCVNCHAFNQGNPDDFNLHIRGKQGGTLLRQDGRMDYFNSKTDSTISFFAYPYWHPSGKYIAYSVNKTHQSFHEWAQARIEVFDKASDVLVYDTEHKKILYGPLLKTSDFETFPTFSPDGRTLYFCLAAHQDLPKAFADVRYNICSLSFDPDKGTFGTHIDTVVNAVALGMSASLPSPSYDGRFLMFTLADYGTFPNNHTESQLALLDLQTHRWRYMDGLNSPFPESHHRWSTNSRWVVFSSRRQDGLFVYPYLAYIDENGQTGKPFLLPQKTPLAFYDQPVFSFNIPEFATKPIDLDYKALERAARN